MQTSKPLFILCCFLTATISVTTQASPIPAAAVETLENEAAELAHANSVGATNIENEFTNAAKGELVANKPGLQHYTSGPTTAVLQENSQAQVAVRTLNRDGSIEQFAFKEHQQDGNVARTLVAPDKFNLPGRVGIQYNYPDAEIPHSVVESFSPQTFRDRTLRLQSGMYLKAKNFEARIQLEANRLNLEFVTNGITRHATISAERTLGRVVAYEMDPSGSNLVLYSTNKDHDFFCEVIPLDITKRPPNEPVYIPYGYTHPMRDAAALAKLSALADVKVIAARKASRAAVGQLLVNDAESTAR